MKFSNTFKGVAIAATLILAANEASAQLPVRTRSLQMLGSTSGTLSHQAAATTTDYTLTWPAAAPTTGNYGILQSLETGVMSWRLIPTGNELVDAVNGAAGQIAYFTDNNTIESSPNFLLNAATATVTIGAAAVPGVLVLNSSGAGNNDVTINTNSANGATFNFPGYGASAGPFNVVATTDVGTQNQIPVVQADGTVTWEDNPITGMQRGIADPTDGAFSYGITVVGTPDINDVILISSLDVTGSPQGNILSVTGRAANSITVSATSPFTASEQITWLWIPIP